MTTETQPDIGAAFVKANELYIIANTKKAEVAKVEEAISEERRKTQKTFEFAMEKANKALATVREKAEDVREDALSGLGDRSNAAQHAASAAWNDLVQFQAKFLEDTGHVIDLTTESRVRKPGIRL